MHRFVVVLSTIGQRNRFQIAAHGDAVWNNFFTYRSAVPFQQWCESRSYDERLPPNLLASRNCRWGNWQGKPYCDDK
jgi:hypothetical protein